MYKYPHGLEELEGIANRTDFDLGSHTKGQEQLSIFSKVAENTQSNAKLAVQDLETKEWFLPFVIEPSARRRLYYKGQKPFFSFKILNS